jgi:hypothetical protein
MKIFSFSPELKQKLLDSYKKIKSKDYYSKTSIYNSFIDDPNNIF